VSRRRGARRSGAGGRGGCERGPPLAPRRRSFPPPPLAPRPRCFAPPPRPRSFALPPLAPRRRSFSPPPLVPRPRFSAPPSPRSRRSALLCPPRSAGPRPRSFPPPPCSAPVCPPPSAAPPSRVSARRFARSSALPATSGRASSGGSVGGAGDTSGHTTTVPRAARTAAARATLAHRIRRSTSRRMVLVGRRAGGFAPRCYREVRNGERTAHLRPHAASRPGC
jgi:hypothetical protein